MQYLSSKVRVIKSEMYLKVICKLIVNTFEECILEFVFIWYIKSGHYVVLYYVSSWVPYTYIIHLNIAKGRQIGTGDSVSYCVWCTYLH